MQTKYTNAFILSGGGTRLMIYLGMYAALEKLQIKPDVLIGTCGGAIAATVINTFSDTASRKEYLKSEEYYQFSIKERRTKERKLSKVGLLALQKRFDKRNAPFVEDVFHRYLAEVSQDLSEELPSLKNTKFSNEMPMLILGSKMLFTPKQVGKKRNGRKLYEKVIFTDSETANRVDKGRAIIKSKNYIDSAVDATMSCMTNVSMLKSARVSVSDMFYMAPVEMDADYFAGGAIDLIPIELAKHLADNVIIENKQFYSSVEEAFVRSVLGYSGNKRLAEVKEYFPEFQIDTKNIKKELEGYYIKKKIDWKRMEIYFEYPKNYQQFRDDMDKQWEYGFQQTLKSIQRS